MDHPNIGLDQVDNVNELEQVNLLGHSYVCPILNLVYASTKDLS